MDIEDDITSIMNEMIMKIETPKFAIGIKRKCPRKPKKPKKIKIKMEFEYTLSTRHGIIIYCPFPELEERLIKEKQTFFYRSEILEEYLVNDNDIGQFLKRYVPAESFVRYQFRRLLNAWIYKKYSKRMFNTEDPVTCAEPVEPIYLFSPKQRGSYVFESKELAKYFDSCLKKNENLFPLPQKPRNPLTNMVLSIGDMCELMPRLKKNGYCSWLIDGFIKNCYSPTYFREMFQSALKFEGLMDYMKNPQLEDALDHFHDFIDYVFTKFDEDDHKKRIIKWASKKINKDDYIKEWRKIYFEYYKLYFTYPTVPSSDRMYDDIFSATEALIFRNEDISRLSHLYLESVLF